MKSMNELVFHKFPMSEIPYDSMYRLVTSCGVLIVKWKKKKKKKVINEENGMILYFNSFALCLVNHPKCIVCVLILNGQHIL